jgi:formate hydrogenlyase subunit 6/NADH:ubiquinone oxidoreductase subunit I
VDYNKCLFCNLCIEVCPKDCIHMDEREGSAKFALITDNRYTLNFDLLAYKGLSEDSKKSVEKVRTERDAKEKEKAAAAQQDDSSAGDSAKESEESSS